MKVFAVIQARMGSSRLPGKVLKPLKGKPVVEWVVRRTQSCVEIDEVILATTELPADDVIADWAREAGVKCFRGSEDDVLARYYFAGLSAGAKPDDIIVRITADCPFIDPDVCAQVVKLLKDSTFDYTSNVNPPTFPNGLDCEAIRFSTLTRSHNEAALKFEREHVTQYIRRRPEIFNIGNVKHSTDLSSLRWTLDHPEDYRFLCEIANRMGGMDFKMDDVLALLRDNPEIEDINKQYKRDEGLKKSIAAEALI